MLDEILQSLASNLVDVAVYGAIALVTIVGLFKCILPVRAAAARLRRAIRMMEHLPDTEGARPAWQDVLFLGKPMQGSWRKFLTNAEQLDARGLACDVGDYVNDDSVIYAVGHVQLADVIPGLLTSLGILGTFIGLMNGLSGLDMSDAAKTMESIPMLISGMTFAFATSIAGISCSLMFNMFNRMATGSATRAIDDFNEAFTDIVMQTPLDDNVKAICQQEDQTTLLRHAVNDMSMRVSDGIITAVESSLKPITLSMNNFILGQTQAQMDGIANIAQQFIGQMNHALGGQFLQLGKTLSGINQSQEISAVSIERAMASADVIMQNMMNIQSTTERVMQRYDSFIHAMENNNVQNDAFLTHGSQVLKGMMTSAKEQAALIDTLQKSQRELQADMKDYSKWSSQVLSAVKEQSDGALRLSGQMSGQMQQSGKLLADSYSSFVEQLSTGLSRSMGMFDENIHSVLNTLNDRLRALEKVVQQAPEQAQRYQTQTEGYITALSKLQQSISDIADALPKPLMEGA